MKVALKILIMILSLTFIMGCPFKGGDDGNPDEDNFWNDGGGQYSIAGAEITINASGLQGIITTEAEALPSALPSLVKPEEASAEAIPSFMKAQKNAVENFDSASGGLWGIKETGFEPIIDLIQSENAIDCSAENEQCVSNCKEDDQECTNKCTDEYTRCTENEQQEGFPNITDVAVFPFTNADGKSECMMAFATSQPVKWFTPDDTEKYANYCTGDDASDFINDDWRAANCTNCAIFGVVNSGEDSYEIFCIEPILRPMKDGGDQLFQYQGGVLYYKAGSDATDQWLPPNLMAFNANKNSNSEDYSSATRRNMAFDGTQYWIKFFYTNPEAPPSLFGLYVLAESNEDDGNHESFFRFLSVNNELVTITSREWDIPVAFRTTKSMADEESGGEIVFISKDPTGTSNDDWQRNLYQFNPAKHFELREEKGNAYCASDSEGKSWVPTLFDYIKDSDGEPILDDEGKIQYTETELTYNAENCLAGWDTNFQGDERYWLGSYCQVAGTYKYVDESTESECTASSLTIKTSIAADGNQYCAKLDDEGNQIADTSQQIADNTALDSVEDCDPITVEEHVWVKQEFNDISDTRNAYQTLVEADNNYREDQISCTNGGIVMGGDSWDADIAVDAEDRIFISGSFNRKAAGTYKIHIRHEGPYCETSNYWNLLDRVRNNEEGALDELEAIQALDTIDKCMPETENLNALDRRWNGAAPNATDGYCMVGIWDDHSGMNYEYYVSGITSMEDCNKENVHEQKGSVYPYAVCEQCTDSGCEKDMTIENEEDCLTKGEEWSWNEDAPWYWWDFRGTYQSYDYDISVTTADEEIPFEVVKEDTYERYIENSWCDYNGDDMWNSKNQLQGVAYVDDTKGQLFMAANQDGSNGVGEVQSMHQAGRQIFLETSQGGENYILALDFEKIDAETNQPTFSNNLIKHYAEIKDITEVPSSYVETTDEDGNVIKTVEDFTMYYLDFTTNKSMKTIITRTYVKDSDNTWTASYSQTTPEEITLKINKVSVFSSSKVSCKSIGVQE